MMSQSQGVDQSTSSVTPVKAPSALCCGGEVTSEKPVRCALSFCQQLIHFRCMLVPSPVPICPLHLCMGCSKAIPQFFCRKCKRSYHQNCLGHGDRDQSESEFGRCEHDGVLETITSIKAPQLPTTQGTVYLARTDFMQSVAMAEPGFREADRLMKSMRASLISKPAPAQAKSRLQILSKFLRKPKHDSTPSR